MNNGLIVGDLAQQGNFDALCSNFLLSSKGLRNPLMLANSNEIMAKQIRL